MTTGKITAAWIRVLFVASMLLPGMRGAVYGDEMGLNLNYRLSFDQIDRFWQNYVGHPSGQDSDAYGLLADNISHMAGSPFGEERSAIVAMMPGDTNQIYIPVVPQDKRYGRMALRLATVGNYLQKTKLFTGTVTDPSQPGILAERLTAAQMEAFMGYLWNFATARTLVLKCQAIKRVEELGAALESARAAGLRISSEDQHLLDLYDRMRGTDGSFLSKMREVTCAAREVVTRSSTLVKIKERVANRLLTLAQDDGTAPLLSGFAETKKKDFEPLLASYKFVNDQMQSPDFNMMAAELRAMRDAIENIKSSFQLIDEDTFCLDRGKSSVCQQILISRLKEINFDQFLRYGDAKDPVVVQSKYYNENIGDQGGLKSILAGYSGIGRQEGNPQGITSCIDVVDKFNVTENAVIGGQTENTKTLRAAFRTAMTACLNEAAQLYDRIAKDNGHQFAIDDAFAGYVMNLSDAILKYKKQQ